MYVHFQVTIPNELGMRLDHMNITVADGLVVTARDVLQINKSKVPVTLAREIYFCSWSPLPQKIE